MTQSAGMDYHVYHDQPDLPAVVLLHGAGGSYLSWPPHLRRMPGCRVHALDLPGHGASPAIMDESIPGFARAVTDWMRATNLQSAWLAGHSMGSAIALQIALDHPTVVRGLCLLGSAASLRVHPLILEYAASPDTYPQAVEKVIRWSFGPDVEPRTRLLTAQRMMDTPPERLYADLAACNAFDVSNRLHQIGCPTLALTGEADRMTPPEGARWLAANIPNARLEIIPGVGHFVMLEAPQATLMALSRFILNTVPGRAEHGGG